MLISIIIWISVAIFVILSLPALKTSSEYRFTKTRQNIEAAVFLAAAVLTLFVSAWFILLGIAGVVLFKLKAND